MNASSQHSAERINPFHFHPVKFFKYQNTIIHFKPEWKMVFSYLSSLQNKYGCIYVNHDAMDAQLGLGVDILTCSECIIRDFKTLGILTTHKHDFRKDFMLLHAIKLAEIEVPETMGTGAIRALFPSALSERDYEETFEWQPREPLFDVNAKGRK